MSKEFNDMLYVLRCAIRNENLDMKADIDFQKVGTLAMQQQIMPIIFPFIEEAYKSGLFRANSGMMEAMKKKIAYSVVQGIKQEEFLKTILNEMEEASIKCILLKGALLADLYPLPELRISGDVDIYVDELDEKRAKSILVKNGFSVEKRMNGENHSVCSHKILKTLELHISLYEDYCTDLWFDSITFDTNKTEKVTTKNNYTYTALEKNEQFLFNILHLIKHFLSSGIGIRQICDILLYIEKNYEELDFEKYKRVMKELKFDYFMDCIMLIGIEYLGCDKEKLFWIRDYEISLEDAKKIIEDIEKSGLFGHNDEARRTFNVAYTDALMKVKQKDKTIYNTSFLSKIFLDYDHMKDRYVYIKNRKWMLPIAWVHRCFAVLGGKKKVDDNTIKLQNEHLSLMRDMKIL